MKTGVMVLFLLQKVADASENYFIVIHACVCAWNKHRVEFE